MNRKRRKLKVDEASGDKNEVLTHEQDVLERSIWGKPLRLMSREELRFSLRSMTVHKQELEQVVADLQPVKKDLYEWKIKYHRDMKMMRGRRQEVQNTLQRTLQRERNAEINLASMVLWDLREALNSLGDSAKQSVCDSFARSIQGRLRGIQKGNGSADTSYRAAWFRHFLREFGWIFGQSVSGVYEDEPLATMDDWRVERDRAVMGEEDPE